MCFMKHLLKTHKQEEKIKHFENIWEEFTLFWELLSHFQFHFALFQQISTSLFTQLWIFFSFPSFSYFFLPHLWNSRHRLIIFLQRHPFYTLTRVSCGKHFLNAAHKFHIFNFTIFKSCENSSEFKMCEN